MSTLNITNIQNPEIGSNRINRCNSEKTNQNKSKIDDFFERHETIRKIAFCLPPIVIGVSLLIENITPYKLLSDIGVVSGIALTAMWTFYSLADSYERSLQNRKIERLN